MADSKIAFVGLGLMGAALARAERRSGRPVVVWNRTPGRAEALAAQGAEVAASLAEAVAACDVVVFCVLDYAVTQLLLGEVADRLRGKAVVQLTSGTPGDARALDRVLREAGAEYLDGAILAYPKDVDAGTAPILYSGPKGLFDRLEPALAALGQATFVGEDVGTAAALDAAVLSFYYGSTLAFLHGAALAESDGVPLDLYLSIAPAVPPLTTATIATAAEQIRRGDYRGNQATLDIHAAALRHVVRMARENGAAPEIPSLPLKFFDAVIERGRGSAEIAAVIDAIRPRR